MEFSIVMQQWAWVGLGAAIVMLIWLFGTDYLRVQKDRSRWRDPYWLSWLFMVGYMFHNVEEYAIDLTGAAQAFPAGIAAILGRMPSEVFFETVNFSLIWLGAPLAAYLGRKHNNPFMATGMAGIIVVNCLTHVGSGIAQGYNAGLATTVLLLVPIAIWCLCVCYGKGKELPSKAAWANIGIGLLYHIIMFGTTLGLMLPNRANDYICSLILLLDAVLIFYLWWLVGRRFARTKE